MRLISFYKIKNKKQVDACILSMKNRINFQSSYDRHIAMTFIFRPLLLAKQIRSFLSA